MQEKLKISTKPAIDNIIDLIRLGNWNASDFLYRRSRAYCWMVYRRRNWFIPEDEVDSLLCFSIGKTIAKYEICGKYWGLLAIIFINDIYDYLGKIFREKALWKRENEEKIYQISDNNDQTRKEITMQFHKALAMKPKEQKICIQLELDGFSNEQIKNILETKKSIKDLKYRAKINLKNILIKKFGWKQKKDN